jgi:hypothetical protein
LKQLCLGVKIKKVYGPVLANLLGYAAELLRTQLVIQFKNGGTKPERVEIYLMVLCCSLKAQLKCDMITEAQLICGRSEDLFLKTNIASSQPGMINYFNYRMKVIHQALLMQFGAFVQPYQNQFESDLGESKKEANLLCQKLSATI